MSEMIERVALAIFKCCFHPDDAANEALVAQKRVEWAADWRRSARHARAAIKAMREPTPRMLDAFAWPDAEGAWRVMIDAALAEAGEPGDKP